MERFELKFWNSLNECITFGFKTSITLDTETEVKDFIDKFTCKDAKEVTIEHFRDGEVIDSYSYDILE